jgi:NADH:ubiquinone oxidoreductase subunit K
VTLVTDIAWQTNMLALGGQIMPTDFVAVSSENRKAQANAQIVITVVLVWIMIGLAMLVLLFADHSFSKASIELMCLF